MRPSTRQDPVLGPEEADKVPTVATKDRPHGLPCPGNRLHAVPRLLLGSAASQTPPVHVLFGLQAVNCSVH